MPYDPSVMLNILLGGILIGMLLFARVASTGFRSPRYVEPIERAYAPADPGVSWLWWLLAALLALGWYSQRTSPPADAEQPDAGVIQTLVAEQPQWAVVSTSPPSAPQPARDTAAWYWQLAAFSGEARAVQYRQYLEDNGHDQIYIWTVRQPYGTTQWKVGAGAFSTPAAARAYGAQHKAAGMAVRR